MDGGNAGSNRPANAGTLDKPTVDLDEESDDDEIDNNDDEKVAPMVERKGSTG